ncbi:MAG: hypothetical protein EA402_04200, partial [Planctomycetota bacterium]
VEGLERLAAAAGQVRDPWARHWLVMPGQGRPDWLQQEWARQTGIASRSQVLRVRALVELAAAGADERRRFHLDALTLAIADCLPDYSGAAGAQQVPLAAPLPAGGPVDGLTLSWARQLADAIDTGLLCRRDPSTRFADAPFLAALVADERLQPALSRHLGNMDATTFASQAQAFLKHWQQREGVPYCWLYLDGGLPEVLWARLVDLLRCYPEGRGQVVALSPSLQFWGDLRTGRRAGLAEEDLQPGPILGPFGRRSQDLHQQLCDDILGSGDGGEDLPSAACGDHLLGRLQHSCRNLKAPDQPQPLAEDDRSFSVHGCRSPLRELEAVRDRIRQALAADPALTPDQILVLLVDPDVHGPLVAAAFAGDADERSHLPFRLMSGQAATPAGIAEALACLWQVLCGRCQREDLRGLLDQPLIRERFQLDEVDNATLMQWLDDASFTWGLNGPQRLREQGPLGDRRHLRAALRRLALGAVVAPEQRDQLHGGSLPLERAHGLATAGLADLARLWQALNQARSQWADDDDQGQPQQASGQEWCQRLRRLVHTFLGQGGPDTRQQRGTLLEQTIPALEGIMPLGLTFTAAAMRKLMTNQLKELSQSSGSGGGGILVGSLAEWAGRPAAMVCICGLSDGSFPRNDERPAWHPLSQRRHWGDASRRDDDRHALLLALLAAQQQVVCTYEAGSTNDATLRPPATPLADLLNAAKACCPLADHARLHHLHPLNGFTPASVAPETHALARSFAHSDALGAQALWRGRQQAQASVGLWSEALPPPVSRGMRVADLMAAIKMPCQCFIRHLGLRLPEDPEEQPVAEPLGLDHLQRWEQRRRLIGERLAGRDIDPAQEHLQASGLLGPGVYGVGDWQSIVSRLPDLEPIPDTSTPVEASLAVPLPHGGWLIEGSLRQRWLRLPGDGGIYGISASSLDRATQAKVKKGEPAAPLSRPVTPSLGLPTAIEMLLLAASGERGRARLHFCGRDGGGILRLDLPSRDAAQAALADWCELVATAMRVAIPMAADLLDQALYYDPENEEWRLLDGVQEILEEKWVDSGFNNPRPAPAQHPAVRVALRGLDDPCRWPGPDPQPDPALALPDTSQSVSLRWLQALADWLNTHLGQGVLEELTPREQSS